MAEKEESNLIDEFGRNIGTVDVALAGDRENEESEGRQNRKRHHDDEEEDVANNGSHSNRDSNEEENVKVGGKRSLGQEDDTILREKDKFAPLGASRDGGKLGRERDRNRDDRDFNNRRDSWKGNKRSRHGNYDGDRGYDSRRNSGNYGTPRDRSPRFVERGFGNSVVNKTWTGGAAMDMVPVVRNFNITPLNSFKTFMQSQREDLTPEIFQSRYEEYHANYLNEFSLAFFDASASEEWFQERYNPLCIRELETDSKNWAKSESERLYSLLTADPTGSVKSMSLEPLTPKPPSTPSSSSKPSNESATKLNDDGQENVNDNTESGGSEAEEKSNKEVEEVAGEDDKKEKEEKDIEEENVPKVESQKTFSGHFTRSIFVTGVHACCSKSVFKMAVTKALTEANLSPAERIALAQPTWNKRFMDKFSRSAWITISDADSLSAAISILNGLVIHVPDPHVRFNAATVNESRVLFSFVINAEKHTPRTNLPYLPYFLGNHARVQMDTIKALQLASLLDEEREVPDACRLAVILEDGGVQSALQNPTDKLDVAICYLRRVHFLQFYTIKRFRDEAHLLTYAPCVLHRSKPYVPAPQPVGPAPTLSVPEVKGPPEDQEDQEEKEDEEGKGEQDSESNKEASLTEAVNNEAEETNSESEKDKKGENLNDSVKENVDSKKDVGKNKVQKKKEKKIPLIDHKLEHIIQELINKKEMRDSGKLSRDEEDANLITEAIDKVVEVGIDEKCKFESEGKVRCCYNHCLKKFTTKGFMMKHMKLKHPYFKFTKKIELVKPFMLARYNESDIMQRPLPPVEVETHDDIELKSVRDIQGKLQRRPPPPLGMPQIMQMPSFGGFQNQGRRSFDENDISRNSNGRDGRRSSIPPRQETKYVEPKSEDNNNRKISNYMDVDAPKESNINIDYGVALPPAKKRKSLSKKA